MSQYHHPKKFGSLCSCQIVSGNTDKKGKGIFHWETHENATLIKEVDFFRFVLYLILTWQHSILRRLERVFLVAIVFVKG